MKCPRCGKRVSKKYAFCPWCGYMYQKPNIVITKGKTKRPGKTAVEKAFDRLGVKDEKTRKQILEEIRYGMKPKEEVIEKDTLKIGEFDTP